MKALHFLDAMGQIDDELVMEVVSSMKINEKGGAHAAGKKKNIVRIVLIAAILTCFLSVTAYAASDLIGSPEMALAAVEEELGVWEEMGIIVPQSPLLLDSDEVRVTRCEEERDLGGYFFHRILKPRYDVQIPREDGWLQCMIDMADGKIYEVAFTANADENDPAVGDAIEWESGTAWLRDNVCELVPEGQTLDELCALLCEYWGFAGYSIDFTNDAFYGYEDVQFDGGTLVSELWRGPYVTVYFEGDQEGVPMYIELLGLAYPGKSSSCLMIGTNHAVG